MDLMADVIEYVRADDSPAELYSLSVVMMEYRNTFERDPFEIRMGLPRFRNMLRPHPEYGHLKPNGKGEFKMLGVEIKVLPDSYPANALMLVHKVSTYNLAEKGPLSVVEERS